MIISTKTELKGVDKTESSTWISPKVLKALGLDYAHWVLVSVVDDDIYIDGEKR